LGIRFEDAGNFCKQARHRILLEVVEPLELKLLPPMRNSPSFPA
jgi:hypothetical protein